MFQRDSPKTIRFTTRVGNLVSEDGDPVSYNQDDEPLPVKPFISGSCLRRITKEDLQEMERIMDEVVAELLRDRKSREEKK